MNNQNKISHWAAPSLLLFLPQLSHATMAAGPMSELMESTLRFTVLLIFIGIVRGLYFAKLLLDGRKSGGMTPDSQRDAKHHFVMLGVLVISYISLRLVA